MLGVGAIPVLTQLVGFDPKVGREAVLSVRPKKPHQQQKNVILNVFMMLDLF